MHDKRKVALLLLLRLMRKRNARRRLKNRDARQYWVQPLFRDRSTKGFYAAIFLPLKQKAIQDVDNARQKFFELMRMDISVFELLISKVKDR